MLFHNSLHPRRTFALAGACVALAPVSIGLAFAAALHGGPGWALALGWLGFAAAFGAGAGLLAERAIMQPLRVFLDYADAMYIRHKLDEETPFVDCKGPLGGLANVAMTSRNWLRDRYRDKAEGAEQRRIAEQARKEHEEALAAAAKEASGVVESLASGLSLLAEGDLEFRLQNTFPPAYQKLKQDFNTAMDKIQDAMRAIVTSVQGVRAGAAEISQAADDLSRRTEHQAASLEETAAALDQLTSTVRRTAEGAREASGVSPRPRAMRSAAARWCVRRSPPWARSNARPNRSRRSSA
jgi:methyl-accepting chemotaxis protein